MGAEGERGGSMADPVSLIIKALDATSRVGFALAILGAVVYAGRRAGIAEFTALEPTIHHPVIVAGMFGACLTTASLVYGAKSPVAWIWSSLSDGRKTKRLAKLRKSTALKNVEMLPPQYVQFLCLAKASNNQRFFGVVDGSYASLIDACLIEIDDPFYDEHSFETWYKIPDYVWDKIILPGTGAPPLTAKVGARGLAFHQS